MKYQNVLLASTSLAVLAVAQPSVAQEPASQAEPEAIDTIFVSGWYIRRAENESIPMTVLGSEDIANSSANSVVDILDRLPATNGNFVSQDSDDQANEVSAGVNLRNLGTDATLILLNGTRQPSLRTATDVNGMVPQVMLQRVEVVKDGASALYGSEAIAGVINFITNKRPSRVFGWKATLFRWRPRITLVEMPAL